MKLRAPACPCWKDEFFGNAALAKLIELSVYLRYGKQGSRMAASITFHLNS
jgi:hypothetical protein